MSVSLLAVIRGQAALPSGPPARAQPIDTAEANGLRYRLLLWAGEQRYDTQAMAWPTLHAVGLGARGLDWTLWLEGASVADLQRALATTVEIDGRSDCTESARTDRIDADGVILEVGS